MGETSTVTIDFRINSWLENAGIVGLTRILKANPRYRKSYKEKENLADTKQEKLLVAATFFLLVGAALYLPLGNSNLIIEN